MCARATRSAAEMAFKAMKPRNQLHDMCPQDQAAVWACLKLAGCTEGRLPTCDPNDSVHLIARRARDLIGSLREIKEKPWTKDMFASISFPYETTALLLDKFARRISFVASCLGRDGYGESTFQSQQLVMAVCVTEGALERPYFKHLATLYNLIHPDAPERLTGNALQKRRSNFKREYPILYEFARAARSGDLTDLESLFQDELSAAEASPQRMLTAKDVFARPLKRTLQYRGPKR